jgi:hypothetical protein
MADTTTTRRSPQGGQRALTDPQEGRGPRRRGAPLSSEPLSRGRHGARSREGVEEARNPRRAGSSLGDGRLIESFTPPRISPDHSREVETKVEGGRDVAERRHAPVARSLRAVERPRGGRGREAVATSPSAREVAPLGGAALAPRRTERFVGSREVPRLGRNKALEGRNPRRASALGRRATGGRDARIREGTKASKRTKPQERGGPGERGPGRRGSRARARRKRRPSSGEGLANHAQAWESVLNPGDETSSIAPQVLRRRTAREQSGRESAPRPWRGATL